MVCKLGHFEQFTNCVSHLSNGTAQYVNCNTGPSLHTGTSQFVNWAFTNSQFVYWHEPVYKLCWFVNGFRKKVPVWKLGLFQFVNWVLWRNSRGPVCKLRPKMRTGAWMGIQYAYWMPVCKMDEFRRPSIHTVLVGKRGPTHILNMYIVRRF